MHARSLLEVAALLVGDEAVAQDVVLDAFADLRVRGRHHDSYEAIDQLRAAIVRGSRSRPPATDGVLASLTPRQREVFVLRWWLGLSAVQLGEVLRLSPRAIDRADAEARHLLPDEDELTAALETQTSSAQLSYDAEDQLRDRIAAAGRRRRRRLGAGAVAALVVVVAVAATLWATRPRPYTSPTGRAVFAAVVPVDELATFDVGTGKPRGNVNLGQVEGAASLPGGGWLVSRLDSGCRSTLTMVGSDGTSRQVRAPLVGQLSKLAVSPDGRYAAGVVSLCSGSPVPWLDVVELRTRRIVSQWFPPTGATGISGLSWAPDSRRLAYTLGTGVGGHGSGYEVLDTSTSPGVLAPTKPSARQIDVDGRSCQVVRSLWLGRTGRFAVFAACLDRNELLVVQVPPEPAAVQHGTVLATLPGSALTLGLDATATDNGRHLLVTTDVATFRIDGSKVTRLIDTRPAPAW